MWVGVRGEMEETLIPRAGLSLETIEGGPIAGVSRLEQGKNMLKLAWGVWQSWQLLGRFKPEVVLLTGGYMSVPVAVAARLRGVPAVVFLPDIEPGAAIKTIARLVKRVVASFAASKKYFSPATSFVATGYPLRQELLEAASAPRQQALDTFELSADLPVLFVWGGSRGAWSINKALMDRLPQLLKDMQVIHVTGTLTWNVIEEQTAALPDELRQRYRPFPYLHEEMGMAFRAANLIVSRAGASMLGEAPLFAVPSILVPYPYAWRYQKINADFLVQNQAAVLLKDEMLDAQLLPLIQTLMKDEEKRGAMGRAAGQLHQPRAAHQLAIEIMAEARGGKKPDLSLA